MFFKKRQDNQPDFDFTRVGRLLDNLNKVFKVNDYQVKTSGRAPYRGRVGANIKIGTGTVDVMVTKGLHPKLSNERNLFLGHHCHNKNESLLYLQNSQEITRIKNGDLIECYTSPIEIRDLVELERYIYNEKLVDGSFL